MLKDLPLDLLQASKKLMETQPVLPTCPSCGAVVGSCIHTDGLNEDALTMQDIPGEEEPEAELSGEKEEVIINPEYKTFLSRHPY